MCGADLQPHRRVFGQGGSSPRVRGRLALLCRRERATRLIPACAGQTRCRVGRCRRRRGLIPACAGQTAPRLRGHTMVRAHPRVCGADTKYNVTIKTFPGSSPRVRGRRHGNFGLRADTGLIPACAGQTEGVKAAGAAAGAHPRVCGADIRQAGTRLSRSGSSPRVRGRPGGLHFESSLPRLIPACAGQTSLTRFFVRMSRAHPRVCGADYSSEMA